MPVLKKTHLKQLEITREGAYQILLVLVIEDDGEEDRESQRLHRTVIWNSGEVDAQMARVNASLTAMKAAPLPQGQINRLKNIIIAVEGVIGWKDPPPPPPVPALAVPGLGGLPS